MKVRLTPKWEIVVARFWNIANEGKSFYLCMSLVLIFLLNFSSILTRGFWINLLIISPFVLLFLYYDYPLNLRIILWLFLIFFILFFRPPNIFINTVTLTFFYFFFILGVWGTFYYYVLLKEPIKTPINFIKLVLENTDSTSANFFEQFPKILLTLLLFSNIGSMSIFSANYFLFFIFSLIISFVGHKWFFRRLPKLPTKVKKINGKKRLAKKVYVFIIDGCRKDQFMKARKPFMNGLIKNGALYEKMETMYPARTVVCFSSMFTGASPSKTGIKSNLIFDYSGLKLESVFDVLEKNGLRGRLIAIAHLLDVFPRHTTSVYSVMPNKIADKKIFELVKETIKKDNPDLLVTQLISVDQTGHCRGSYSKDYIKAIEENDKDVQDFFDFLKKKKLLRDSVVIVMADHGQSKGVGGHAHWDYGEVEVPFIIYGKNIKKGLKVKKKYTIMSLGPTLTYLFGLNSPKGSSAEMLKECIE